jgi:hypothetical protein
MSKHTITIESVFAEDLLELPSGVYLRGARVLDGNLILVVDSDEDLGHPNLTAVYGNIEEDEKQVHFAGFEPKE